MTLDRTAAGARSGPSARAPGETTVGAASGVVNELADGPELGGV
jgi:hypothetical protein